VPTPIDARLLTFENWTLRLRAGTENPAPLLLLLHGWTGDENSMGLFVHSLPARYTILAPRAPFTAPEGGYTWREIGTGSWGFPSLEELKPAAEALVALVDALPDLVDVDRTRFDLIGFSQGAALSYVLALNHPDRVRTIAALSGFLPEGAERLLQGRLLEGKKIFVAHGTTDKMVPVERARQAAKMLEGSGVRVSYCESDAGHKVSKDCLKGLEAYFREA
jgi:phospholipase/carboxylesterase